MKHFLILAATLLLSSCGYCNKPAIPLSGKSVETTYAVRPFTALEVSHAVRVVLTDTATTAHVIIDSALVPYFEFRYDGNELNVGFRPGTCWIGQTTTLVILPWQDNLNDIDASGASVVELSKTLNVSELDVNLSGASIARVSSSANALDIDLSGASIIEMSMQVNDADIELSGASIARLSGVVRDLELSVSGASQISAEKTKGQYNLTADYLSGSISGASIVHAHVNQKVDCSVSGASMLYLTGNPNTESCSVTGASKIIRE